MKFIKKILKEKEINKIKYLLGIRYINKFKDYKDKKKIIYTLVPTHGNMGDQAIAYATLKYLEEQFSEYEIIQVNREDTYKYCMALKKVVNKDDIIFLHGGGNMGNLYPIEEQDRRAIIHMFDDNKIISMTQTISFTDDENGKKEFIKTKRIYENHKDLTLIAREQKSFNIMKKNLNVKNIVINPDIVLYLNEMDLNKVNSRTKIMTCLRDDKESILGNAKDNFINELNKSYINVFNYDTVIDKRITKEIRKIELEDIFNKFRESKLVITDRLHGMVFAAITKTPCIVTKSLDHKVTGTYEWIRDLNYIRLVDNLDFKEIKPIINELYNLEEINKIDLNKEYFWTLRDKIL